MLPGTYRLAFSGTKILLPSEQVPISVSVDFALLNLMKTTIDSRTLKEGR